MTRIAKAIITVFAAFKHLTSETKFAIIAKEEIANSRNTATLFTLLLFVDVTLKLYSICCKFTLCAELETLICQKHSFIKIFKF